MQVSAISSPPVDHTGFAGDSMDNLTGSATVRQVVRHRSKYMWQSLPVTQHYRPACSNIVSRFSCWHKPTQFWPHCVKERPTALRW
jgi:hypothetical protein